MKKKVISIIMVAALAVLPLVGCTETEADADAVYEVIGGISEPTRVWNEAAEVVAEAPVEETTEEAYEPTVYSMEPQLFVTNKTAELLTSDKDWEVTGNVEEGTELTLVGYTGKGYYQTEDGYFISASDVEAKAEEVTEEKETQVVETEVKPQTTTTTTTTQNNNNTTTTQESQPEQTEAEQPAQEQTPVTEQETPTPAPEPTPEPQPTQEVPVTNTIVCGECGATFATDEECVAHVIAAHSPNPDEHSTVGCSHPNAWEDENGMLYCPDCGGYVSHNG